VNEVNPSAPPASSRLERGATTDGGNPEKVLDVGCGYRKTPGSIGMDVLENSAADVIADLSGPWPFADGSFDKVVANHVLEHVPEVVHVVQEAYRVLKSGGRFIIRGPHFSAPDMVWSDPTHRRALSIAMFLHFQPDALHPYSNAKFRLRRARLRCALEAQPGQRERWFRPGFRRALQTYENWVNDSMSRQQLAERVYYRFIPFFEVEVELEAF
jgi:SAM-dependent methyltransferase